MKKLKLEPMGLDKVTIAKLDDKQLQEIVGGLALIKAAFTGCGSGGSTCGGAGGSTGCGGGGSTCNPCTC
jgi:bacteriocin-like protein